MSDIWVNAFLVIKSKWTDEEERQVGELVLKKLRERWDENRTLPNDITMINSSSHAQITVATS